MGEIDYQMALLLQHKYQQEELQESLNTKVIDMEYARSLQEQFDEENAIEQPSKDLVYKKGNTLNSSKCLTDPSWEVIDPTPDIHMLFIAFNERFFWNKLLAVCVSWSKRMTTCAGICSYQGRSGLCSITLSEPLLKLRPRKDLVETLLHEMIHALLFVTNNNRDRDGHGPEFHSHMYRINKEAGTNITVYHDFHDEVRLYKQHWWKCNGPCQNWKPYFGMVRRAMNRAPGPNDRWWGEHSRSCGGTFVKVKEPEKPKKVLKPSIKNENADIRKYISGTSPQQINSAHTQTSSKPSISQSGQINSGYSNSNIRGVSKTDTGGLQVGTVITSKVNNIVGFTNSSGKAITSAPKKSSGAGGLATANRNGSVVLINNNNRATTSKGGIQVGHPTSSSNIVGFTSDSDKKHSNSTPKKSAETNVNVATGKTVGNCDYSVVRNHWLNKFSNSSDTNESSPSNKRKSPHSTESAGKIRKINSETHSDDMVVEMVECPVCNRKVVASDMDLHLDDCLDQSSEKECFICGSKVTASDYESHVNSCADNNLSSDDVFEDIGNEVENKDSNRKVETSETDSREKKCGACNITIPLPEFDVHVEKCLHKMFDRMEQTYRSNDEMVSCLACNKQIRRTELDNHLEDCMNVSNIFEEMSEPMEESNKENSYNCPCCMKLIAENEMSFHINRCLNITDDNHQVDANKAMLLISLSDDSFG